ncbi:HPP family protein [Shewanella sp. SG41-4]|uniref:HPP family protein n=1 Tax=Shewanella sp. SG41-4 TaxID=2760976 RepID=UPI001600F3B8|nr:HPP family protein [Shewanella sp. SG41-4]MBB1440985.1 HPP family protein [Shewanella sp. SG41-4]
MNRIKSELLSGFGATIIITFLAYLQVLTSKDLWLMAPFGATAVLVFGVPESPLARAKNVIFGHLITTLVGLVFLYSFGVTPITLGIATGLGIFIMLMTKTTHPPAGANPILVMMTHQTWFFLINPVLVGALSIVVVAHLYNRLRKKRIFNPIVG